MAKNCDFGLILTSATGIITLTFCTKNWKSLQKIFFSAHTCPCQHFMVKELCYEQFEKMRVRRSMSQSRYILAAIAIGVRRILVSIRGARGRPRKNWVTPVSCVSFSLIPEAQSYESFQRPEERRQVNDNLVIYSIYYSHLSIYCACRGKRKCTVNRETR